MTADFVVSLSRKIEDKLAGTGRWHVIKNRFGPDGMTLPSKANMSNGRINIYSDDSIDGKKTQSDMNKRESLGKEKFVTKKYNEMEIQILISTHIYYHRNEINLKKKTQHMTQLFTERVPFKPFEHPIYYTEGWLKQTQMHFGYILKYQCKVI